MRHENWSYSHKDRLLFVSNSSVWSFIEITEMKNQGRTLKKKKIKQGLEKGPFLKSASHLTISRTRNVQKATFSVCGTESFPALRDLRVWTSPGRHGKHWAVKIQCHRVQIEPYSSGT